MNERGGRAFQWRPNDDRWDEIPWTAWCAFMGSSFATPPIRSVPLANVEPGVAYFVVCVLDDDKRTPINLIPHKYLIAPNGMREPENFAGLNKEERKDLSQSMIDTRPSVDNRRRYETVAEKEFVAKLPPRVSVYALIRALGASPKRDSLAEKFLRDLLVGPPDE